MGEIIHRNEEIESELSEIARQSVENTLNAMLDENIIELRDADMCSFKFDWVN